MIRRDGGRLYVSGPVTLANVAALLEQARAPLAEGVQEVDLGEVTEVDSSLLAALLAWLREAKGRGAKLGSAGHRRSAWRRPSRSCARTRR